MTKGLLANLIFAFVLVLTLFFKVTRLLPISSEILIVLSIAGVIPVVISAIKAIINRKLSVDLLASIALVFAFIAAEWNSAVFINLMLTFARIFDIWTQTRTKRIIEQLMKFRPQTARVTIDGEVIEKPIEEIKVNDLVTVHDGERIPVDGVVISGAASVDESTLTGESEAVSKKTDSQVFASTLIVSGSMVMRVSKLYEDSTLARIIKLVEEASRSKAPTERVADTFTQWYITIILLSSIILYLLFRSSSLVLSILLVVCADDIAIAVPLTFTVAIAYGAQRGILIKGSDVIEKLAKVKNIITDKTGTITKGKPIIQKIEIIADMKESRLLEYLGSVASCSTHPVDIAIITYIKEHGVKLLAPENCHESPGEGSSAKHGQATLDLGKIEYIIKKGTKLNNNQISLIDDHIDSGLSVSALSVNHKLAALILFEDEVKTTARATIEKTKQLGVTSWFMITGDNQRIASRVANEVGIDSYKYNVLPDSKLDYVKEIKSKTTGPVAMIGDGINDAAALASADVSIAMGAIGSDTAIEAADIALMNDQFERIPEALEIGRVTNNIVRQCFVIWAVTNTFGLFLVALGVLNPVGASFYNLITDFFPIMTALSVGMRAKKFHI